MNCPNCGKEIKNGMKFCVYCGCKTEVEPTAAAYSPPQAVPVTDSGFAKPPVAPRKPEKKRGKGLIAAIVAVVAALALIGGTVGVLLINKGSDEAVQVAGATELRTVRGKVDTEAVKLSAAKELSIAVFPVDIDKATGRATVSPEPITTASVNENGEYEVQLPAGDYIIETVDGDDGAPGYHEEITVPERKRGTGSPDEPDTDDEPLDVSKLKEPSGLGFDTGFKYGQVFGYNGVAYYADKNGLRRDNNKDSHLLDDRRCLGLAFDGETVYYSAFDKDVEVSPKNDYMEDFTYSRFKMCSVSADGKNKKTLFSCMSTGRPICVYNNKLYYTDSDMSKREDSYFIFDGLYSFDLKTKKTELITEHAQTVAYGCDKIFCRRGTTDASTQLLHCYDLKTEKLTETDCGAVTFWIDGNTLYCTQYEYSDGQISRLVSRDITDLDKSENVIIREDKASSGSNNTSAKYADFCDSRYVYYRSYSYGHGEDELDNSYYRYDINKKTTEHISDLDGGRMYSIIPYGSGVVYSSRWDGGKMYLLAWDSSEPVECGTLFENEMLVTVVGDYAYCTFYDENGDYQEKEVVKHTFRNPSSGKTSSDTGENTAEKKPLTQEEAESVAREFWKDTLESSSADGTVYGMMFSGTKEVGDKTYYTFSLKWKTPDMNVMSTIDWLYVDKDTGECTQDYPS